MEVLSQMMTLISAWIFTCRLPGGQRQEPEPSVCVAVWGLRQPVPDRQVDLLTDLWPRSGHGQTLLSSLLRRNWPRQLWVGLQKYCVHGIHELISWELLHVLQKITAGLLMQVNTEDYCESFHNEGY